MIFLKKFFYLYQYGERITVVVPKDVNIGDMLENLTNGLFVSARHSIMALELDFLSKK